MKPKPMRLAMEKMKGWGRDQRGEKPRYGRSLELPFLAARGPADA
jgi:hypothetical protein